MSVESVTELIAHIQNLVRPRDSLPDIYDSDSAGERINIVNDYPRTVVPEWVQGSNLDLIPVDSIDDLIFDNDDSKTSDISNDIKKVETTPNPDAYAYYCPFHFFRSSWGIYIYARGILAIAGYVSGKSRLSASNIDLINSVYRLLLEHETFHYWVEVACSRFETPTIDFTLKAKIQAFPYEWYFIDRIAGEHEEAMSNAHALRALGRYHLQRNYPISAATGLQSLLSNFMEKQPPGYRDFATYLSTKDFKKGQDDVVDNIRENTYLELVDPAPKSLVPGRHYFLDRDRGPCPIYLVSDSFSSVISTGKPFPAMAGLRVIVHTNEHNPPHFHLESPIGDEIGRYEWPNLKPLKGSEKLSKSFRKKLNMYLAKYGKQIGEKIQKVFG